MKAAYRIPLAFLAAAVLFAGCAAQSPAPAAYAQDAAPVFQAYSPPEPEIVEPDPVTEKYIDVLEGVYYDYVLPDGTRLDPFEENETDFPNEFAIFDVDGDGEDELIIRYINTYTAAMFGVVYGYDRNTGKLTTQLLEFPSMSFYPNGTVEVGWSHNQGLAGRFWPCTFYQYDAVSDCYLPIACVDAWDCEFFETDFDGNPFPAQADTSGDNIVYYIYQWNGQDDPAPVSQTEFDAWHNGFIGFDPARDSQMDFALDIPYQPLTEETISAIC